VKNVFRRCLNVCRLLDSRIPVGSLFQTVGAAKLTNVLTITPRHHSERIIIIGLYLTKLSQK